MGNLKDGERQVAATLEGIRRDHVARYEFAASQLVDRRRVLDVACGVGYGAAILADAGHQVIGVDRSFDAVDYGRTHYARPDATLLVGEASELFFERDFDAAVCFETIEHLEDPLPLLTSLHSLAPLLIASVPNEAVFPHAGRVKFHHRHYTRAQFHALLESTGWKVIAAYGQAGPESEVERGVDGRTLIAVCERAPVKAAQAAPATLKVARPAKVPDHVAIVALGPSCVSFFELTRRLGGVSAYCDEVWGINAIGDVLRCDRVFHMDDVRIQEARAKARPGTNIAAMLKWLKTHPGPVYTSVAREGYPGMVDFPLQDVLNGGYDSSGGVPYFNSTPAYAIAYAIHIGVKKISLYGIDYTLPNRHEAEKGRACCEFWLGIAAARGIEVNVPDTTSLLDAAEADELRLYGYDCVDVTLRDTAAGLEVRFAEKARIPTAAEIEARYDHSKHPSPLLRGKKEA